jgi:hypothetical protein
MPSVTSVYRLYIPRSGRGLLYMNCAPRTFSAYLYLTKSAPWALAYYLATCPTICCKSSDSSLVFSAVRSLYRVRSCRSFKTRAWARLFASLPCVFPRRRRPHSPTNDVRSIAHKGQWLFSWRPLPCSELQQLLPPCLSTASVAPAVIGVCFVVATAAPETKGPWAAGLWHRRQWPSPKIEAHRRNRAQEQHRVVERRREQRLRHRSGASETTLPVPGSRAACFHWSYGWKYGIPAV